MPCFRIQGVKRSSSPKSKSAVGSPQLYLVPACHRAPTVPSAIWLIESQSESWTRGGSVRKSFKMFKFRQWPGMYETLGIMEPNCCQLMLAGLQLSAPGLWSSTVGLLWKATRDIMRSLLIHQIESVRGFGQDGHTSYAHLQLGWFV